MSKKFNDTNHHLKLSEDGSYTAYSQEYGEHYHSTKDGALHESLAKHVVPALSCITKDEITILDICYGLGLNTLATLWYVQHAKLDKKIHIYSPELDASLVDSLEYFTYPKEFENFSKIIYKLAKEQYYEDDNISIEIFLGDAREYVKRFEKKFDIVYQDAFSPSANPMLWTVEYFADIQNALRDDGVLTTYSTALKTRLALYENGFKLYLNSGTDFRNATVASQKHLPNFTLVDMEHKISCNPSVKPLSDSELGIDKC
jgi:tRNA U34 5-methylaminomethyl-2-thiouridine-forming methyltransferase MnmC